ncbi:MAG: TylF/MycF/NovP-related O-methyltransferase [Janthinobacterium lividum]
MNNFYVASPTYHLRRGRKLLQLLNAGLRRLHMGHYAQPLPNPMVDMSTLEQRINYFHLLDAVLAYQVPGEVVELGCFTGQCALLFQQVLAQRGSAKQLHLYDSFEVSFTLQEPVEQVLHRQFAQASLPQPVLHKGYFEQTVPAELPAQIAFAHIDCGFGGDALAHKAVVLHCLRALYPRLSCGAVCVLMDYQRPPFLPESYGGVNPGVLLAGEEFLAGKPEQLVELYGNQYAHAFFRKLP